MKKELSITKKICLCFLFLFSIILLSGCASITQSRLILPDGKIKDSVVVELDVNNIKSAGITENKINEVVQEIKSDVENIMNNQMLNCLTRKNLTQQQKELVVAGVKNECVIVNNYTVVAERSFASIDIFNIYFDTENQVSDNNITIVKNAFMDKFIQKSKNNFSILTGAPMQSLIEKYSQMLNNQFSVNNLKLTQIYASPNTKTKSNATATKTTQGMKMHIWEIDPEHLDFELQFYTNIPNVGSWYIFALIVSLVVLLFIWLISLLKKNKVEKEIIKTYDNNNTLDSQTEFIKTYSNNNNSGNQNEDVSTLDKKLKDDVQTEIKIIKREVIDNGLNNNKAKSKTDNVENKISSKQNNNEIENESTGKNDADELKDLNSFDEQDIIISKTNNSQNNKNDDNNKNEPSDKNEVDNKKS